MAEIQTLLEERQVRKAVIIDDVFDEYPRADEMNSEDWTLFFDDLSEEGDALLKSLFPDYESTPAEDLQNSPEFIKVVWDNRKTLPQEACGPLFSDYEVIREDERTRLDGLAKALKAHGLTCTMMGSDIDDTAKEADLIFVDLFLGFKQTDDDMSRAIDRISHLIKDRKDRPPLVVLMSRSSRLIAKRNDFRDQAGLLGSTFRVIGKADLSKTGELETLLVRLARPYDDAKRVAAFVKAWDDGLNKARENFIQRLRRLDLSDLAQIRTLLLDFEGQSLGEYLLDVADRVLQHEIEADPGTIAAALELSKIDPDNYPAPHLEGSADLQELVHRMIFQHVERLKLSDNSEPAVLQFGDLLRYKNPETGELDDNVIVILTPACDLLRCSIANVLALPGKLQAFVAVDWLYGNTAAKIPIFITADGSRYWIKWNVRGYHTVPINDLQENLGGNKTLLRIGRLREVCAIELQQRMLLEMGRIGQTANPPATFPVSIDVYAIPPDGAPVRLDIPDAADALCFVGRGKKPERVDHLVLTERSCDALRNSILNLSEDDVHQSARPSLASLKTDIEFFDRFERGSIEVPIKPNSPTPQTGIDNKIYMHLVRNEWNENVDQNIRKAPIILKICDLTSEG
ncbi:MAG: hypothetical protein ACKVQW_15495 [Pyrinomonadaceae bacterium]